MANLIGVVTARSQYGIKVDDEPEWFNWSKEEYRTLPWDADKAVKGACVICEVDGKYIKSIKVDDDQAPPKEVSGFDPDAPTPAPIEVWNYEKKDRLMCRESCAKSACSIFAASITTGIYKTHPDVSAVTAYAQALEKWCLEAI